VSEHSTAPQTAEEPEEIGRRRFLVQATIAMGSVVGLGLVIPLAATLWPKQELLNANKGWSPLTPDEFAALKASLDKPVKINFTKKNLVDGYLTSDQAYYVWGIHLNDQEMAQFKAERPDLFDPGQRGDVNFDVGTLGFVLFSSVCPHLQCKFAWDDGLKAFLCPCHGSQFSKLGVHMKKPDGSFIGPAPRGLDPVPFREQAGSAEVEWVKYAANIPTRLIVSYS
jgi:Rieske Fe-S protein